MTNCVELPVIVRVASDSRISSYFAAQDIASHASKVAEACEKDDWGCVPRVVVYEGLGGYLCAIVARFADEADKCEADMRGFIAKYSAEHPDLTLSFGTEGL